MKKKIFISIYYMKLGGVERSLLGLLNNIDYKKYTVDLFIHNHSGELLDLIPENVNVLPENKKYATFGRPIKKIMSEGNFFLALLRMFAKIHITLYNKINDIAPNASAMLYITKYTSIALPSLFKFGKYDLAISFIAPHNIVLDKVNAKKKIAWIHTDYSKVNINRKMEEKIWRKYDHIISISESVTNNFLKIFPALKDKIILIENILPEYFIKQQADLIDVSNEIPDTPGCIKLCSVGRFSEAKNFINAVDICRRLVNKGLCIKWYLIGYGSQEQAIRNEISKYNLKNNFIILGKKNNPYPYIKACDIYVQPSRYEGKAVTVIEAQILNKPVVITNYSTSKSQLTNGYDGLIIPMDNKKAADALYDFIKDKKKQAFFIQNTKKKKYSNEAGIIKLYELINND